MKIILTSFLLSFIIFAAQAQHLSISQENGKLFLEHEVLAKQNWYTIGRIYNVSPKEIAPFNETSIDKILSIGQLLKIPLTENNFAQAGQPEEKEVFIPLFHTVKEKEGLFRVSAQYNKVDQASLKAWNNLKSNNLSKGTDLIVGFLRVKKEVSLLAKTGLTEIPEAGKNASVKNGNSITVNKVTTNTDTPSTTISSNKVTTNTAANTITTANSNTNTIPVPTPANNTSETISAPGTEGAFASVFDEQTRGGRANSVSGTAAIFRSTSGWKDGKYYVLMDSVPPGSIIKIMSSSNGRVVYAKVLNELPSIRENDGLLIRISNAAAAQLMMNESKFEVSIQY